MFQASAGPVLHSSRRSDLLCWVGEGRQGRPQTPACTCSWGGAGTVCSAALSQERVEGWGGPPGALAVCHSGKQLPRAAAEVTSSAGQGAGQHR